MLTRRAAVRRAICQEREVKKMRSERETDFAMERRLRELDAPLHRRFTDAVFCLQKILSNYKLIIPDYTDHSEMHSLTVINFCNRLIGDELERLNPDEIYCLLMGCYFHDTGMGVSRKDYEEFSQKIDFGDYFKTHDKNDVRAVIRDHHNRFSRLFIEKYAAFFEIPSPAHLRAIAVIALGHRKTDLCDGEVYPTSLTVPGGNAICLPYLAALVRLADEIDVASDRNSPLVYQEKEVSGLIEFKKHRAVKELIISEDAFTLTANASDPDVYRQIEKMTEKMQVTLDDCRRAVNGRTPHTLTQKTVRVRPLPG